MGELHEIYQIKPEVLKCGAFLKVKGKEESVFEEKYLNYIKDNFSSFPHNTDLQRTTPELVVHGQNQYDRIVKGMDKGLYILVQSGSKHGFEKDFTEFLKTFSDYFEDYLFFVLWDFYIYEYRLENGIFSFKEFCDHDYSFRDFYLKEYGDNVLPEIITEDLLDIKVIFEETEKSGENPYSFFDMEDLEEFETLLSKTGESELKRFLGDWIRKVMEGYCED